MTVFDGNGAAIRQVDLSTSLHRAIQRRKYLRNIPSIVQYPFIATAQYLPSQLTEQFFGFYWRKVPKMINPRSITCFADYLL